MTEHELELQLRALGPAIDFPASPDLRPRVHAALTARRRLPRRRLLAVALAVLVVAIAGVLAVPSARTAIRDWLGIGGVQFQFVDKLPARPVTSELDLGVQMSLADARERASFPIVVPPEKLGRSTVYLRSPPRGGLVSFLYGTPEHARLIVSELRADYTPFLQKTIEQTGVTTQVEINGQPGFWLEGAHYVEYADAAGRFSASPARLAGRVLLWSKGPVTYRLEGPLTQQQAVEIAESIT
jgi:hypothetical protein